MGVDYSGFTNSNYTQLTELYQRYKDKGMIFSFFGLLLHFTELLLHVHLVSGIAKLSLCCVRIILSLIKLMGLKENLEFITIENVLLVGLRS